MFLGLQYSELSFELTRKRLIILSLYFHSIFPLFFFLFNLCSWLYKYGTEIHAIGLTFAVHRKESNINMDGAVDYSSKIEGVLSSSSKLPARGTGTVFLFYVVGQHHYLVVRV